MRRTIGRGCGREKTIALPGVNSRYQAAQLTLLGMRPWAGVEYYPEHMRGGHVSKRVSVDISLDALQAAIGEWPGVGEVASRLGTNQHHIHDMLDNGRLKGIRTRVGWIIHPACVERVVHEADRPVEEATTSRPK